MTKILDGSALAKEIRGSIKNKIAQYIEKKYSMPKLCIFLIGNNDASTIYVNKKKVACQQAGIEVEVRHCKDSISEEELLTDIEQANNDDAIDGILVQLPFPEHISTLKIACIISCEKDIDGFNPFNVGMLAIRSPIRRACTPKGVMRLLAANDIQVRSKKVVIVGVSNLVGRPLYLEFLLLGATVTCCHRHTSDLEKEVYSADILCSAIGKRNVIKSDWIPDAAVVVDIGINRDEKNMVVGDLNQNELMGRVQALTPVPGGVGPMTVAMVMENTMESYIKRVS